MELVELSRVSTMTRVFTNPISGGVHELVFVVGEIHVSSIRLKLVNFLSGFTR